MGFIGVTALLKPFSVRAGWNAGAFAAKTEHEALSAFFPGKQITPSDSITISVNDLVENGAVVPIRITTDIPAVQSITILVEKNPNPLVADFELSPECTGFVATRIKVAEPSDIIAIVRSEEGVYSARKFVKVVEGGCG